MFFVCTSREVEEVMSLPLCYPKFFIVLYQIPSKEYCSAPPIYAFIVFSKNVAQVEIFLSLVTLFLPFSPQLSYFFSHTCQYISNFTKQGEKSATYKRTAVKINLPQFRFMESLCNTVGLKKFEFLCQFSSALRKLNHVLLWIMSKSNGL